jgi:photosystem II stability/assembly factor-like uncharacterized protein
MRQLVGYAMSALVIAAVAYAFAPRSPEPLAATQLHADRVQVNDMLVSGAKLVAVGERGTILTSADQGLSWDEAKVEPQRAITLTGVTALNDKDFVAVGHDGWKLRSTDGGANWTEVGYESEQGEPILGVWTRNGKDVRAFGSYGKYFESSDAGLTWTVRELEADGLHLNGLDGGDSGRQLLVGEQGLVLRSTDHGQSWERLPAFYSGSLFGVARLNDQVWVAYGMRGHVFRTRDFGQSWQQIELNHHHPLYGHVLLPETGGVVIVGAGSTLVHLDGAANLHDTSRRNGLGTLTSAVALGKKALLVGGEKGVYQGATERLAAGQ